MALALKPPHTHLSAIEPGELLPPFARRYDESLGATLKQQIIRDELHRRKMEEEETQAFRDEVVMDRHRVEDSNLIRGIFWGMIFSAFLVATIALSLMLLGVHMPW